MSDYINYVYPELHKPIGIQTEYPTECPLCGAPTADTTEFDSQPAFSGPVYECGGQYTSKPQIQNHTDKWWGLCPSLQEKARQTRGVVCEGCGEKRLEGCGFPRHLFGWNCRNCGHENPKVKE